ncbi:MAG: thiamine pyrophosphate-dependent dehydrogenase E1 component subunit alpha [Candidatus Caldarchaeum sp.]|nr:thiamine pyrophosphate-dependent dehydrogenase E1 component subunit alpha [Candidatus Caldarchaeum sp.]MDW8063452.1 thiamine pyrophosphate-dependent dehydrogenase E1 component subunit alpha [Candidatus Caldarchaeum sp.]
MKTEVGYALSGEKLLQFFRKMLELRMFEEKVERLYREGKIAGPTHLYIGQEAVAVGVIEALDRDDIIISTYRGHGHGIARGVPMKAVLGEILGRAVGTCKGLGGSMHAPISVEKKILFATAIVGSGIPIAVGVALGFKNRNSRNIAVAFFGDGAVNTGAFHEALNLASVWSLPVLFVCENNLYAMTTAFSRVFAGESIASRASCYGIKAFRVNGNDVVEVYHRTLEATNHIREGGGPAFLECLTYRQKGHGGYDLGTWYRPREELDEWLARDPIELLFNRLKQDGLITEESRKNTEQEIAQELDKVADEVLNSPVADFASLQKYVYSSEA